MKKERKKDDQNEYLNWFWNPVYGKWVWTPNCKKACPDKDNNTVNHNGQFYEKNVINREIRKTPEEMTNDLQSVFCKGRYRSWAIYRKKQA